MTPLRQKMIDAMMVRGFSPRTHQSYLYAVTDLARHYKRSPESITLEQIRDYFVYLVKERHLSDASCQVYLHAIRFMYLPLWNRKIDGFGNHNPGKGRYNQHRSPWDTIHQGRPWADKLQPPSNDENKIKEDAAIYIAETKAKISAQQIVAADV